MEELENRGLLPDLQQKYMTALANPHWLLQPITGKGEKDIFQVNILQHLILFGQEACPDWALERKVTERPEHADTMQSPLCSGLAHLVLSESALCCGAHLVWGWGQGLPSCDAALESVRVSGNLTFMN